MAPRSTRPTLDEIRGWPATVSIEDAAAALGVSRAHAYATVKAGTFPARTVNIGTRVMVITSSIMAALGVDAG